MKSTKALIIVAITCTACANYQPMIDNRGVDMGQYNADLSECQQYAHQVDPGSGAVVGAVLGGLLGFALARAAGSNYDASASARVGAVAGGASGAAESALSQQDIIRNCLRGRGYSVLR